MSKGRYREPRRRGFDDDNFSPREMRDESRRRPFGGRPMEAAAAAGPAAAATVKWFNPEKGFGFVELTDGSGDAFLHVAVLQAAGHDSVEPGTKLRIQVGQGQKGRQVTAILELDSSSATATQPKASERGGPAARRQVDAATAVEMNGMIKWFNPDKGFGFVAVEDGGKDVFLHISVVERAGLRQVAEGERVSMRVVQGQKGREAVAISLTR